MGVKQSMNFGLLWFLCLQGGLLLCIMAQTDNFLFIVDEAKIPRLCQPAQILLTVNGTFPGPNITVTRGATVNVTVQNKGPYPITIHWHGVKQLRNPWSDGPEYITQNPIPPYEGSFNYTLRFSDEEGTLWWHAHSDWSRASVHGAIIVLPAPTKKYPFEPQPDHNRTIILGSWFKYDRNLTQQYLDSLISGGDVDPADSYTINGYPGQPGASCDDIDILQVDSGKTYHLRIINAVMEEEMFFAISGHTFTVVGLDGAYLTPIPTNHIMITPGQTMDILLTANQSSGNYYMGASAFVHAGRSDPIDLPVTRAIINYSDYTGSVIQDDLVGQLLPTDIKNVSYANEFTDRIRGLTGNPDYPITVPTVINKNFLITISVNSVACIFQPSNCTGPPYIDGTGGMHTASLNNQRFVTKEINILQAYRCKLEDVYTEDFPATPPKPFDYNAADTGDNEAVPTVGTKVMTVNYGDAVEIVFQGTNVGNAENHPMHIHGYNFYLVANGSGNFGSSSVEYRLDNPAQANTFGVPKNGWLAVRFQANNPGVWFLHCHLERHATWGMAGVLIVKNTTTDVDQTLTDPPAGYPPCPLLN
ncbi:laccase-14-like [Rosa rugosa]|uniref:laccase-14-like n=1 Tax=Rosa rugosa TaxID=74645 RepID=UPI002B40CB53|nr:laccase-14-like [Rosa rugosa]